MHKVIWDQESGGVLLTQDIPEYSAAVNPPCPVFYEELDLLGFDRYWDYPKCEEPLLWAVERDIPLR